MSSESTQLGALSPSARGFMMTSENRQRDYISTPRRFHIGGLVVACLALSAVTLSAMADDPPAKASGTRIVQPIVVQVSFEESQDSTVNKKLKQEKGNPGNQPPNKNAAVPNTTQPPTGSSGTGALPEPPKFPNLDSK